MTQDLLELAERLFAQLPGDGSPRTNAALRQALGVEEDLYWDVRRQLIDEGRVRARRGRGGSTARVVNLEAFADRAVVALNAWWRVAEVAAYSLASASMIGLIAVALLASGAEDYLGYLLALFSLGITAFGAGVAVTIYRLQTFKQVEDQNAQGLLLQRLTFLTGRAAQNTADLKASTDQFIEEMREARAAAEVSATLDVDEEAEDEELDGEPSDGEVATRQGIDERDIIRVPGDGEYRRPGAVPIRLLAYLVQWWEQSTQATGQWTVGNLVGAYRRYGKKGTLRGAPWILTFRRSGGEQQEYRIALNGRKPNDPHALRATVSLWAEDQHRWIEGQPLGRSDLQDGLG